MEADRKATGGLSGKRIKLNTIELPPEKSGNSHFGFLGNGGG